MTTFMRAVLERCATRRVAAAALAGVVACVAGLVWRQQRLGGLELLDSRGWYTPGEAAVLFDELDRLDGGARLVYAATGLTIDMVFPVACGLLPAIMPFRLFRNGAPLYLLPLARRVGGRVKRLRVRTSTTTALPPAVVSSNRTSAHGDRQTPVRIDDVRPGPGSWIAPRPHDMLPILRHAARAGLHAGRRIRCGRRPCIGFATGICGRQPCY